MNSGFPLFRAFGTEIRIHWTWVILLAVITVTFGQGLATQPDTSLDPVWSWGIAIAIAALVLVSVVIHELGHVGLASRNRLGGGIVVVQLLGGAYLMDLKPRTAGQELRIASAGSLISVALALAFGGVFALLDAIWSGDTVAPTGIQAIAFVVQSLALFNAFVAAVNLIPAYPLDGGRIVHALAWARSGKDIYATRFATRFGRMVGYAVMIAGVATVGLVDIWPGIALLVAGWLLVGSSRVLERRLVLQELISGARVSEALDPDIEHVPPQLTLDVFASPFLGEKVGTVDLVERDQKVLGLVGTAQVRRIPQSRWPQVRTEEAMVPLGKVPRIRADSDLWVAIETLERSGLDAIVVTGDDRAAQAPEPQTAEPAQATEPAEAEGARADAEGLPAGEVALMTRRSVSLVVRARIEDEARPGYAMLRRSMFRRGPGGSGGRPGPRGRGPGRPPRGPSDDGAGKDSDGER